MRTIVFDVTDWLFVDRAAKGTVRHRGGPVRRDGIAGRRGGHL